jgi:hypothetical protein
MECPFLKKINFKKINQITHEEPDCELLDMSEPGGAREEDFDFEEESVENINCSNVNPHQLYYFNSKINPPESSRPLTIKFPKQFEAKKMFQAYPEHTDEAVG